MRFSLKHIILFLTAAALSACSLVDEDLSDCETDYHLSYELRLVTNMKAELQTQLSMETEVSVANAIRTYLSGIFTDYAKDVDLSFYDVYEDSTILHHESHIMDANQSSYTLYIPVRKYMHLAMANVAQDDILSVEKADRCHTARLSQQVRDTIPSHKSGIFTARLPMDIKEGMDQQFDVRLYMANCATAIVVDTLGSGIKDLKVYMSGFATGLDLCDSLYHFDYTPVVKGDCITPDSPGTICYGCVTFPSRTPDDTKVVIDTDDPGVGDGANEALWQIKVYSEMKDGTVTETILGVSYPVGPGIFKLIKARAYTNGSVKPGDPSIAVSVTTDWEPATEHDVII